MRKAAVILSVLAMVLIVALVAWWKLGGFYTVSVINIFNLQSRLSPVPGDEGLSQGGYGGAALLASAVRELKKTYPDALLTESGDLVMGPWWRIWKGQPEFSLAASIGVEAGMLGNHEFNLGQEHLREALAAYAKFPILATNIIFQDQELAGLMERRLILNTPEGVKIGLFSLVPARLTSKTKAGDGIEIEGDLAAVAARNVAGLKKDGVDAVMILTHCSLEENLALAAKVEGIALIISGDGGHGGEAEIHWASGPGGWPTAVVTGGDSGLTLPAFSLTLHRGRPIPELTEIKTVKLSPALGPDPEIEKLVADYAGQMDEMLTRSIGSFSTPVDARRDYVRSRPAPLGNFIADAYRWKTGADIAVVNGGGIRGDRIFPSGPISTATIMEMMPFQNIILVKEMSGKDIRLMLEYSASALIGRDDDYVNAERVGHSGFLHLSGLKATFALGPVNKPLLLREDGEIIYPGNRVKFAGVLAAGSVVPLNDGQMYTVAMPDFLASGGDKYGFLSDFPAKNLQVVDYEAVTDFVVLKHDKPLNLKNDGRLVLEGR